MARGVVRLGSPLGEEPADLKIQAAIQGLLEAMPISVASLLKKPPGYMCWAAELTREEEMYVATARAAAV